MQRIAYLMNLELNFVYNSDFRLERWAAALMGFENAINARPDHYFAHHYAAECQRRLGAIEKAESDAAAARRVSEDPFWRQWISLIDAPMKQLARS